MYQEKTGIQSLHAYSETWTQLIRRPSLEDHEVTVISGRLPAGNLLILH